MNGLSLTHLGAGTAALLLGCAILAIRKGTANHRTLGWIYVVLTVAALVAILLRTRAAPRPFAGYAAFTLVALAAGVISSYSRSWLRAWRGWHAGLMLLTLLGAAMAAASIAAGVIMSAPSGVLFYRMFNAIIVAFTATALVLIWRSRTIWGAHPGKAEIDARRRYVILVTVSSLVLTAAQWPLAFP
jgi:uncharacterized membrane protein